MFRGEQYISTQHHRASQFAASLRYILKATITTLIATPVMAFSHAEYMTRAQLLDVLRSVHLFTVSFQNLLGTTYKLIHNIVIGASDPTRTRLIITPQVVTGLSTLQSAVQDLSRAYIAHTNTVIGKAPGSSLELLSLTNPLGSDNVFFGGRTATPGPTLDVTEGKKRKRAPHDKNAPKRPVTPYFLYMQTARSLIAGEMEPSHSAKEVADEGTRRWNDMPPEEREVSPPRMRYCCHPLIWYYEQLWSYRYGVNFARYKEKVKAYKAGLPIPDITDAEAKKLYEEQKKVGITHEPPQDDLGHMEEPIDTEISDADASSIDESPEPPKVPSPPKSPRSSKRRRSMKEAADKISLSSKQTSGREIQSVASPEVERISKSPEKERKKKSTRKREAKDLSENLEPKKDVIFPIASSPKVTSQDTQAKQKRSKKKRKSEAMDA